MTIDGYFEGEKKWDLNWHNYAWGDELEKFSLEQLKSGDLLLFGRETYQGMANYWTTAEGEEEAEIAELMNSIPKIVISSTLEKATWNNTKLIKTDAIKEITKLKKATGKDILIFGSANLISSLMGADLIDEYRLCIVPVILGTGQPLFKEHDKIKKLNLLKTKPLKTGGIILTYEPDRSNR